AGSEVVGPPTHGLLPERTGLGHGSELLLSGQAAEVCLVLAVAELPRMKVQAQTGAIALELEEQFALPRRHLRMEEETDGEAVLGGPGGVRPDPIGAGLEVSWTAGVRVGEVPCPLAVHAHGDVDPVDHCNLPFERGVSQLVERRRSVLEKRGSRRSL